MAFFERVALVFEPIRDYLVPFFGFDAFVSLVFAALVAGVILHNRLKNQAITLEMESLIRRYIIFRGHRKALMKIHQKDEDVTHAILKAISNSWNHFKDMLEGYSINLHDTDRRSRNFLLIVGTIMVLNSLRKIVPGVHAEGLDWLGLILLVRELPIYVFLVTGFGLIRIQSHRLGKEPWVTFHAELDAIFSDAEKIQEALNNEFDPIDQLFPKEASCPEEL